MSTLNDYCITFVPQIKADVEKKLMSISQIFVKLPEDSAEKLKNLFDKSTEFSIEEFDIHSILS